MKGHLTHRPALDMLQPFSSLGDKAGAVASRGCTALQEESREEGDRNSESYHRGRWVGEQLQEYVSEHTKHTEEKIAERGSPCSSDWQVCARTPQGWGGLPLLPCRLHPPG